MPRHEMQGIPFHPQRQCLRCEYAHHTHGTQGTRHPQIHPASLAQPPPATPHKQLLSNTQISLTVRPHCNLSKKSSQHCSVQRFAGCHGVQARPTSKSLPYSTSNMIKSSYSENLCPEISQDISAGGPSFMKDAHLTGVPVLFTVSHLHLYHARMWTLRLSEGRKLVVKC